MSGSSGGHLLPPSLVGDGPRHPNPHLWPCIRSEQREGDVCTAISAILFCALLVCSLAPPPLLAKHLQGKQKKNSRRFFVSSQRPFVHTMQTNKQTKGAKQSNLICEFQLGKTLISKLEIFRNITQLTYTFKKFNLTKTLLS